MHNAEKFVLVAIAFGLFIAALHFNSSLDMSFWLYGYAIAGFLIFTTYTLRVFTKTETYYIISIVRTKRFIGFIEKISKTKLWDKLADIGIVLGFGAIAVDYLLARHKTRGKRIAIDLASIVLLFLVFHLVFGRLFVASTPKLELLLLAFSIAFALGGLMLFAVVALVWQAVDILVKFFAGKTPCPGVAPIIPGVQIPNVPANLTPPFYIWIAFVVILVVHEFSHGALMKRAKAKIKSVGVLLAGIFPIGAFVEPDEKEIKKKPERNQLRIYAIGPASNIFSIFAFILLSLLVTMALYPIIIPRVEELEKNQLIESIEVKKVLDDYDICGNEVKIPAKGEIEEGWLLLQYNGVELTSFSAFKEALMKPDQNVSMVFRTVDGKTIEKTLEKNQYGKIGVEFSINYVEGYGQTEEYFWLMTAMDVLIKFFGWLLILSFAIAVVNFLPIEPFDGGKIAKIIFLPYFGFLDMNKEDTEKFIGRVFLWIVAGLLLINAFPLLL